MVSKRIWTQQLEFLAHCKREEVLEMSIVSQPEMIDGTKPLRLIEGSKDWHPSVAQVASLWHLKEEG